MAGESAGAVYTHAHAVVGTPVKRVILQSGSLFLSPPMSMKARDAMLNKISEKLQAAKGAHSLQDAPAESLLHQMQEMGISSMSLQAADGLDNWQRKRETPQALMVGDCEFDVGVGA